MLDEATTLRDLWKNGQLSYAQEYLRRVFIQHNDISKDLGECVIRIGLTGTGHSPNYRVEPILINDDPVSLEAMISGKATSEQERVALRALSNRQAIFSGRSHKRIDLSPGNENWSRHAMTLSELQALRQDVADSGKISRRMPS